jgi:repressor LexA
MMTPTALTDKEQRIYGFIKTYFQEHSRPPTYQEIQKEFSYSAISTVQDFLSQLKTKGYIRAPFGENKKRAIELVDFSTADTDAVMQLPLLGKVAAGRPIEAIETRDYVEVPRSLLRPGGEYFALTVKGDSMIEDCIMDGDYVVIKRQASAANGQTVVAIVDSQATIKRFYQKKSHVELHPANPNYDVIHVEPHSEFKILGVLSSVIRRLE